MLWIGRKLQHLLVYSILKIMVLLLHSLCSGTKHFPCSFGSYKGLFKLELMCRSRNLIFLWTGWGRCITLCNSGYLCLSYPSWNYVSFRIMAVGPSTVGQKMLSLILKVGFTSLIFQIVLLFLGVLISTLLSYLVVNLSRGCVM